MNTLTSDAVSYVDDTIYQQLLKEVEFQCSSCHAIQQDIEELNLTIERIYHWVVSKSRGESDLNLVKGYWLVGYIVASDIFHAACLKKNLSPICALDIGKIESYYQALRERVEFLLGVELKSCE